MLANISKHDLPKVTGVSRSAIAVSTIYGAGLLQGFAFVLIPALATLLKGATYHLSASQYGSLFLPMTAGAIVSALTAGTLDQRIGTGGVLRLGLIANILALLLLVGSNGFAGRETAYAMLLAETALLGLGFGLNLAAVNHLAAALFPRNETAAVTLLNATIGAATALSPLLLSLFQTVYRWWLWPVVVAAGFVAAIGMSLALQHGPRAVSPPAGEQRSRGAAAAWLFAAAVLVYAVVEGTFGSWATLYVSDSHHLPARFGAWALSAFWGTMTAFRLGLGLVPARLVSPRQLYRLSPIAIAACFLILPFASTPWALVATYGAAGVACSIYYPYSMSFALEAHPRHQTRVAGLLVAALMAGEGIGSYAPGPLQGRISLAHIYGLSAFWALPLLGLAFWLSRPGTRQNGPPQRTGTSH